VLGAVSTAAPRDDAGDLIRRAKKDLEAGRVVAADSGFALAAQMAEGDERAEAMFLRAGIVRSGKQAEELYQHIVADFAESEWARPAALELVKILYATGRYETTRVVIGENELCAREDQACVFDGMAANMLRDYSAAAASLVRVTRGREKQWAAISLAEAQEGLGNEAMACERYADMARSHPTAWLRHAECIENGGDAEGAKHEYEALAEAYPYSPEAIRASAKISPPPPQVAAPADAGTAPGAEGEKPKLGGTGFTIQFGSFADRANAIKLAAKIKSVYPAVRIDGELVNYREVFRVRYGQYATRDEAQAAAEAMARQVDERYTVMPIARAANE
jgi:hypothetical protein